MPTQEALPTQDIRPKLGALIFQDQFEKSTGWQTGSVAAGNVAIGENELTLAVSTPRGILTSLRTSPQFDNFYLEVDLLPSLCTGEDAFGLLLRAISNQDYYRLLINCNAQMRLERIRGGRSLPLQDWTLSGQIRPGGLLQTRLGVWADGSELDIFVNGAYQFSIKDPVFTSGTVGVFARAAGDTSLSVSFSNLMIYAVPPGQAHPKIQATPTPAPTLRYRKAVTPGS